MKSKITNNLTSLCFAFILLFGSISFVLPITMPEAYAAPTPVSAITDEVGGFTELTGALGITTVVIGGSTYALVTGTYDDGVEIIDITTPSAPTPVAAITDEVGGFTELYGAAGITTVVIGGSTYALVTGGFDNGVQIIDITTPSAPTPVAAITDEVGGFTELYGAAGITTVVIGGSTYALVTGGFDNGVQIIDITTPSAPTPVAAITDEVGGFTVLDGAQGITTVVIGGSTYALVVAPNDNGVQIIDITTPSAPTPVAAITDEVGGFTELLYSYGITTVVIGGSTYALVAAVIDDGVQIIDITTPSAPTPVAAITDEVGGFTVLDGALGITTVVIGGSTYALVAASNDNGVQIIDITTPSAPTPVSAITDEVGGFTELLSPYGITPVVIGGSTYALVTGASDNGVQIIDITSPFFPPTANDDSLYVLENAGVSPLGVISNDVDVENDPLEIFSFTQPSAGSVILDDNGTPGNTGDDFLKFNHPISFPGGSQTIFTYNVTDGTSVSNSATVTLTSLGTPSQPPFGETINLSNNVHQTVEYDINSQGNNVQVAWVDTINSEKLSVKTSNNKGLTFGPEVNVFSSPNFIYHPRILEGGGGVLHLSWVEYDSTGTLYYSRSTNNGASFSTPAVIGLTNGPSYDMAVSGNNVYIAYTSGVFPNEDLLLRQSTNSGASFTAPKLLGDNVNPWSIYVAAYDPFYPNVVYVAYDSYFNDTEAKLLASVDNANTFSNSFTLCTGISDAFVDVDCLINDIDSYNGDVVVTFTEQTYNNTAFTIQNDLFLSHFEYNGTGTFFANVNNPTQLNNLYLPDHDGNNGWVSSDESTNGNTAYVLYHDVDRLTLESTLRIVECNQTSPAPNPATTCSTEFVGYPSDTYSHDFDSDGDNVYMTWVEEVIPGKFEVQFGKSLGDIHHMPYPISLSENSLPYYTSTSNSHVIAWFDNSTGDYDVFVRSSNNPADIAPVALGDYSVTFDTNPVVISPLVNDYDDFNSPILFSVDSPSKFGATVTKNSGGTITYAPIPGKTGVDSFVYTITDSQGFFTSATVDVQVIGSDIVGFNDNFVNITSSGLSPSALSIGFGQNVTFRNTDTVSHDMDFSGLGGSPLDIFSPGDFSKFGPFSDSAFTSFNSDLILSYEDVTIVSNPISGTVTVELPTDRNFVNITSSGISPSTIQITLGQNVTFRNTDTVSHDMDFSGLGGSPLDIFSPGNFRTFGPFNQTADLSYDDITGIPISGTVSVFLEPAGPTDIDLTYLGPQPTTLQIRTGEFVTFRNTDTVSHDMDFSGLGGSPLDIFSPDNFRTFGPFNQGDYSFSDLEPVQINGTVSFKFQPVANNDDHSSLLLKNTINSIAVLTNDQNIHPSPLSIHQIGPHTNGGTSSIIGPLIRYTPTAVGDDTFGYIATTDKTTPKFFDAGLVTTRTIDYYFSATSAPRGGTATLTIENPYAVGAGTQMIHLRSTNNPLNTLDVTLYEDFTTNPQGSGIFVSNPIIFQSFTDPKIQTLITFGADTIVAEYLGFERSIRVTTVDVSPAGFAGAQPSTADPIRWHESEAYYYNQGATIKVTDPAVTENTVRVLVAVGEPGGRGSVTNEFTAIREGTSDTFSTSPMISFSSVPVQNPPSNVIVALPQLGNTVRATYVGLVAITSNSPGTIENPTTTQQKYLKLIETIEKLETQIQITTQEIAKLAQDNSEKAEKKLKSLNKKLDNLEKNLEKSQKKLLNLDETIEKLETQIQITTQEITKLAKDNTKKAEKKLNSLNKKLDRLDEKLQELLEIRQYLSDRNSPPSGDIQFTTSTGGGFTAVAKLLDDPITVEPQGFTPDFTIRESCDAHGGDSDGDALCNNWEDITYNHPTLGVFTGLRVITEDGLVYEKPCIAGNTYTNDPSGATVCPSVNIKDLYVELDYMELHKPSTIAVNNVVSTFLNSNALDSTGAIAGIHLHMIVDEQIPHESTLAWASDTVDFADKKETMFGEFSERAGTIQEVDDRLTAKRQAFLYGLFVHNQLGTDSSGVAEKPGNDFMVSLGSFTANVGSIDQQGATLLHEIGHNLGLSHGGLDGINCKPNYQSVMNYLYQFDLPDGGLVSRPLDFSRYPTTTILETRLYDNSNALEDADSTNPSNIVLGGWDPTANTAVLPLTVQTFDIITDWNRNTLLEGRHAFNTHYFEDIDGCQDTVPQRLDSHKDWNNVSFNFRNSGGFDSGIITVNQQDDATVIVGGPVDPETVKPIIDAGPDENIPEYTYFPDISILDPHSTQWDVSIDYGDGDTDVISITTGNTVITDHDYITTGPHTVTVTVENEHGGIAIDTVLITTNTVPVD